MEIEQPTGQQSPADLTLAKMTKDLRQAAATLSPDEVRFLVSTYYTLQEQRIRSGNQVTALTKGEQPHAALEYFNSQFDKLEKQIASALKAYVDANPDADWPLGIWGIGPVLCSGLLAHLTTGPMPETVGHWWSFAGLVPGQKWEKGKKRPWNAELKTLCWKVGESFVKVSGKEGSFYGQLYRQRKEFEQAQNDAGKYAEAAAEGAKRVGKATDAYKSYSIGKLPPGHIHARAKRYAVKIFLSHLHEHLYERKHGRKPPNPFPIQWLGHVHKIGMPAS